MTDQRTQSRLQELLRRESRSFLQYVNQATPWAAPQDGALVDKLRRLGNEENEALGELAEWMDKRRIALPYLGAFPMVFTNFNFVGVRKLMKPLVEEQRKELADLESDARSISDPAAKAVVEKLVELNRKHLNDFEQVMRQENG